MGCFLNLPSGEAMAEPAHRRRRPSGHKRHATAEDQERSKNNAAVTGIARRHSER